MGALNHNKLPAGMVLVGLIFFNLHQGLCFFFYLMKDFQDSVTLIKRNHKGIIDFEHLS